MIKLKLYSVYKGYETSKHLRFVLSTPDAIPALVNLLYIENAELQSVAASVLCNTSENTEIRQALTKANAGPILIQLLASEVDDIQSRAAIILSDIACVEGNQVCTSEKQIVSVEFHQLRNRN